jgi:hypothetical protein
MENSPIIQRHIEQEVAKALVWSRLPHNHRMSEVLCDEAQVVGRVGHARVRIPDAKGNLLTLEERIQQLKLDPRFSDSIPNPAKIAKSDVSGVRDNFDEIAKGTAVLE